MSDTYTKEQIEKLISQPIDGILYDLNLLPECFDIPTAWRNSALEAEVIKSLKSALSTAEQERDNILAKLNFGFTETLDVSGIWRDRIEQHHRADIAEARCAELEARLRGAADRAVEYMHDLWDGWSDEELRAAILGEKKE